MMMMPMGVRSALGIVHSIVVQATNAVSRPPKNPEFPAMSEGEESCATLPGVGLVDQVLPASSFDRLHNGLLEHWGSFAVQYRTKGRVSSVLSALVTDYLSDGAVSRLHHSSEWRTKLARAAGIINTSGKKNGELFPLDDKRFRMAFTTHVYEHGSFNGAHRDSSRTQSKTWTVILGVESDSASGLVIEGKQCPIQPNQAVIFEGWRQLHWVPVLTEPDARRVIIFLEYTEDPPKAVQWHWKWADFPQNFERVFLH
eukprot:CAMPEP_0172608034 /NCGR_PEP_ID=MMETSP1068-20121228/28146_1 /TAXON_ID=35684 /ORGANISM="Pseudopedinella elastica, Strain CCMP716" /LENGTH=255 /DNA_ID=CAMNT_0013411183 /DNA_START=387 /DNA_END=1154 /DNA_ORIENTATION=-